MVLPAAALIAGVVLAVQGESDPRGVALGLAGAWLVAVAAWWAGWRRAGVAATAVGFLAAGALHGAAAARTALDSSLRAAAEGRADGEPPLFLLEGRLRRDAAPTPYGASLDVEVRRLRGSTYAEAVSGTVRLAVGGSRVAERIDAWRAGRVVRLPATLRRPLAYRNPGVPDEERRRALQGVALVGSVKSALLVDVLEPGHRLAEAAAAARAWARRVLSQSIGRFDPQAAGIVTAILIGDRAGLDEQVERRLQRAGTYHVIAISGGNIAVFAALVLGVAKGCGAGPRVAAALAIAALASYAYLVEAGASVVRATAVAITYLAARLLDLRTPPVNALALAALLLVTWTPLAVFDVGFVLTFGAAVALVLGVPRVWAWLGRSPRPPSSRLERLGRAAAAVAAATLVVEVALLPVSAAVFSLVTLAGFVLNFAAIPLMTVAQVMGLATCAVWPLSSDLARVPGFLASLAARGLVDSARLVELVPWLAWQVSAPSMTLVGVYYAALLSWWSATEYPRVRRAAVVVAAVGLAWILAAPSGGWFDPGRRLLRLSVLDVGQGDAVLLRLPGGPALLVDAGGSVGRLDIGERVIARALWALGVRRLETLVVTHGDPDHLVGAPAIVREFRPREIWEGVPVPPHASLSELARQGDRVGAAWRTVQRGDRLRIGSVELRILHPPPPDWERQRVRNDDSIVLQVRYGRVAVLLPGDIGRVVEEDLVAQGLLADPERELIWVVKVPHHGSAGSSSAALVAVTRPRAAIVSAGRGNFYGHPAPIVVTRYLRAGAALFRTDEDGAVHVETDGRWVVVRSEAGRRVLVGGP